MAEARKLITTTHKGEHEIQTWHVTYFDMDLEKLDEIWEEESDDYEGAYHNGLCGDMDGELNCIFVGSFLVYCSISLKNLDDDSPESKKECYNYFLEELKKFEGYTIYPSRTKNKK